LRAAFRKARTRPTQVLCLLGGRDFWSNGHPPQRDRGCRGSSARVVAQHQRDRRSRPGHLDHTSVCCGGTAR
jgi:hypothetical protein